MGETSARPQAQGPPFVFDERVGLAKWTGGRGCLSVFNAAVRAGTRVVLVEQALTGEPPVVAEATVSGPAPQPCDASMSFPNQDGATPSFYQVAMRASLTASTLVVVAILDPPGTIAVRGGQVEGDLDADGAPESFRVCTGAETVHFLIRTAVPAPGLLRWRGYYTVNYDMTPSCTEQDVAEMAKR